VLCAWVIVVVVVALAHLPHTDCKSAQCPSPDLGRGQCVHDWNAVGEGATVQVIARAIKREVE